MYLYHTSNKIKADKLENYFFLKQNKHSDTVQKQITMNDLFKRKSPDRCPGGFEIAERLTR